MSDTEHAQEVEKIARDYYDSDDADGFYFRIWGGEDIHIGIYETPSEAIATASVRTVARMADVVDIKADTTVLDIGSGYGGSARWLVKERGCRVSCLNLSAVQNKRNEEQNAAAGMADKIEVITGTFEDIPKDDATFDVVWSQDAILHSGHKAKVFDEVKRVLKPGGVLVFTDPMQADDVAPGVLDKVLARIHLDTMGSFKLYGELGDARGMERTHKDDLTQHLVRHYTRVREELVSHDAMLSETCSRDYLDRMAEGLSHWIEAGTAGHLAWGIQVFKKS